MSVLSQMFSLLVFPGLAFCVVGALSFEWIDRKIYARLQNRMGPPWYQPAADLIKLLSKDEIVPEHVNKRMTEIMAVVSVAASAATLLYIPVARSASAFAFEGDLVVVLFMLTLPTVAFFLSGWYSASPFGIIGAVRSASQFLAYEIPLTLAIAAPAVQSGSWSISKIAQYGSTHVSAIAVTMIGLFVALVALQGKLERVPFDAPEAETEVVAGTFTEFSGRRLAFFRLACDIELLAGSILLADLFLGGPQGGPAGFLVLMAKALLLVFVLSCARAATARLRVSQVVSFCWKVLVPVAALQMCIVFLVRGLA